MRRPEHRIARFVEDLLRNRRPRRLRATPEELEAMRAAVSLRAARTGAGAPDPTFVDRLGRRLRRELGGEPERRTLSRRGWLLGAGAAAAAAIAGAAGDRLAAGLEESAPQELAPAGATWRAVAAAASVPDGRAVRFSTGAVEGFVVNRGGSFHAVSAVCTHLGCILQAAGAGHLSCPCHRSAFALDGTVLFHELAQAPRPLPRLRARVRDDMVEVFTA